MFCQMISCALTKKMNTTTYVYFLYERGYRQFYVGVTGKETAKFLNKKYKIESQHSNVHS